jgi:multiple sugar transport system ATP-binding protein
MNLIEAQVRVNLDRHVALWIGDQALYLPWSDIRARTIAHYHGERIVLGLRAEALTPAPMSATEHVIRGTIRYIEHHGHESLAYLDIGATAVLVDDLGGTAPEAPAKRRSPGSLFRQVTGRGPLSVVPKPRAGSVATATPRTNQSVFAEGGRRRRSAEFTVRLAPYPNGSAGQQMAVQVAVDQAHFFDEYGKRIDVGWR